MCKSVQEIRSYRAKEILHCDLKSRSNVGQGDSPSNLRTGGMNDWVKYYIHRCMQSEVIALTSFYRANFFCSLAWSFISKVPMHCKNVDLVESS